MPNSLSSPEDDAFARRLWRPEFQWQVRKASRTVLPAILRSQKDDLIEEALVKAYHRRDQFRGTTDEDLLGWVLVIHRNMIRDLLKSKSEDDPEVEPLPLEMADRKAEDPALAAERAEEGETEVKLPQTAKTWTETAKGLLGLLPEDDREVLLLRLGMGLSAAETARVLSARGQEVTEGAVRTRTFRAQRKLNEMAEKVELRKRMKEGRREPSGEGDPERTSRPEM
jgi:RNA polymerase sigma factor (sigma-70 family)